MDNPASYGHPGGAQGYKITSKAVPCGSPAITQIKNHPPAKVSDTGDISDSYKQKRYFQTTPQHNEDSVKEIRGSCKRAKGAAREPKVFVKNSERLTVWARTGRPPMPAYARAHTHTRAPVATITATHAHTPTHAPAPTRSNPTSYVSKTCHTLTNPVIARLALY